MNKSISKFLASALAATMVLSVSAFAADVDAGAAVTTTGTGTPVAPSYKVAVPDALDLKINPMKIGASVDDQLYTGVANIVNKSNVNVEVSVKIAAVLGGTVKPTIKTEDEVAAASADILNTNKYFSLYVAPAEDFTVGASKIAVDASSFDAVPPTSYIGVGTTNAAFVAKLDVTPQLDIATDPAKPAWVVPTDITVAKPTMTAFKIIGSCNKNAAWADGDIKPAVTISFAGVDADSYAVMAKLPLYTTAGLTKATSGTGAFGTTPRFRDKVLSVTAASAKDLEFEYGSAVVAAVKASQATASPLSPTIVSMSVTKDGLADTTTFANTAITSWTIADLTGETGLAAKITVPTNTLTAGKTYVINSVTFKVGTASFTSVAGGGITLIAK